MLRGHEGRGLLTLCGEGLGCPFDKKNVRGITSGPRLEDAVTHNVAIFYIVSRRFNINYP